MANFWNETSGKTLTILQERQATTYNLPLKTEYISEVDNSVQISIISGAIPAGMKLNGITLSGSPFEVAIDTIYTFVVRATQYGVSDERTFKIVVVGPDSPEWKTPKDSLPVGANNTYYILDSAVIDFQLEAIDTDLEAGQTLEYFIQEGDGELPPGIKLTTDGKLVGIVDPVLALEKIAGSGHYDSNFYGQQPYDFGIRPDNGFDSFFFDVANYDISIPSKSPKKLNRYYSFFVSVTDFVTIVKRKFQIYVVGDDFLRADNTVMQVANGIFTADNTFIRVPIWLTPENLGFRRANNYITIFLDVIDPASLTGLIVYSLRPTNPDGTTSELPTGMVLDASNGEISGRVPYQAKVTKNYSFTIRAERLVANSTEKAYKDKTFKLTLLGEVNSTIVWQTAQNLGNVSSNYNSVLKLEASSNVPDANIIYTLINGKLPSGLTLSLTGEIIGTIRSFGSAATPGVTIFDTRTFTLDNNSTTIDRKFTFTVQARDHFGYSAITKEFNLTIKDPDGKLYSNIYMQPMLKSDQRTAFNNIITNNDIFDSNFIYRPSDPKYGIQNRMKMLVYAGIESKNVQTFVAATATNHKRKRYRLGDIKTAIAKEPGSQDIVYEIVYIEVIDPADATNKKTNKSFTISTKNKITVDQSYFDQTNRSVENLDPEILELYARSGILEHKFNGILKIGTRQGDVTAARPLQIGNRIYTDTTVSIRSGSSDVSRLRPNPINTIKTDFANIKVDQENDSVKYISNITNMRENIKTIGVTEIEYMPLWMRTSQTGSVNILGYTKAIPLCYCKPGKSIEILQKLQKQKISFNQFDFDIDRYVIDQTSGNSNEQYLLFHNYTVNV